MQVELGKEVDYTHAETACRQSRKDFASRGCVEGSPVGVGDGEGEEVAGGAEAAFW
jgi:hypothetical protein